MKAMVCEMCQSNDFVKQDGMYVCQYCGTKYTVEEARKLIIEGTVDVSGSTVKVDVSEELANLYQIARRAKDADNAVNAEKYYDMILVKDPFSWEASFYVVYFKAKQCQIREIESALRSITNCLDSVFNLIKNNVSDHNKQKDAYTDVANRVIKISEDLSLVAMDHYNNINTQIQANYTQELVNRICASIDCLYSLGNYLDELFGSDSEANDLSITAWKKAVLDHQVHMFLFADKDANRKIVDKYVSKIRKYEVSYNPSGEISSGCYVATAVYGSYDCPQVWTLRRFRDNTLAETWYGRAFIHLYYAISPTLVKWFGKTEWFKNLWKPTLDCMVEKLNKNGVEDTPYNDRVW